MEFKIFTSLWMISVFSISTAIKTYSFEYTPDGLTIEMSDDLVYSGRLEYNGGLAACDKEVTIATDWFNADKIMFYLDFLDLAGTSDNCSDSYLQIFDATGLEDKICGNERKNGTYTGTTNALKFKYSTVRGLAERWRVTFTAYHEGHCMSYEYRCKNERCISHSLRCGGNDPCGDNSDCLMTYGAMAAIALGGACALGSVMAVIFVIFQNRKRLYRRHKRQPHTFTPAHSFENLTSSDFCQESVTSLDCQPQTC